MTALLDGFREHVARQVDNGARLFSRRDELVRAQESEFRVIPAHQRFDTADVALFQAGLRLIPDVNLTVADGGSQVIDDTQASHELVFTPRLVGADAITALPRIGAGDRGEAQEIGRIAAMPWKLGDPDLGLQCDVGVIERDARSQYVLDPLNSHERIVCRAPWQDQYEFIGACVTQQVAVTEIGVQVTSGLDDQFVRGFVAESRGDLLQSGNAQRQDRDGLFTGTLYQSGQVLEHLGTVWQVGQVIVRGLV